MKRIYLLLSIFGLIILTAVSCEDDLIGTRLYEDQLLISQYLEDNEEYSELLRALQITKLYDLVALAGTYTLFAPDNDAFQAFYQEEGKSGLEDFDPEYLSSVIASHILEDSIQSIFFKAGALSAPNYDGGFMIISFQEGGLDNAYINGVRFSSYDLSLPNGIIHEIEGVISPTRLTLAELIQTKTDYSIFNEALVRTGLLDTLNTLERERRGKTENAYFTILAEPDEVFIGNGINSIDDLISTYSTSEDLTDKENGLNTFMSYHILNNFISLSDFTSSLYSTLTSYPLQMEVGSDFQINKTEIDSLTIKYASLEYELSNVLAKNGIIHSLTDIVEPISLEPSTFRLEGEDLTEDDILDGNTEIVYGGGNSYVVFRTESVGDFIEFEGPFLFQVPYDIYIKAPSYNAGSTILDLMINGERVNEPFVNDEGNVFIGTFTPEVATSTILRINVVNAYVNPNDNNIRFDRIEFIPQ